MERAGWNAQFQILFAVATEVAWLDHKAGLSIAGANRREFFREARRECIRFLRMVDLNVVENLTPVQQATPVVF